MDRAAVSHQRTFGHGSCAFPQHIVDGGGTAFRHHVIRCFQRGLGCCRRSQGTRVGCFARHACYRRKLGFRHPLAHAAVISLRATKPLTDAYKKPRRSHQDTLRRWSLFYRITSPEGTKQHKGQRLERARLCYWFGPRTRTRSPSVNQSGCLRCNKSINRPSVRCADLRQLEATSFSVPLVAELEKTVTLSWWPSAQHAARLVEFTMTMRPPR